jgi:fructoselysine-6-P-deglycase FrlB-like protein
MLEKDIEQLEGMDVEAEATALRLMPDVLKYAIGGWALNRDAIDEAIDELAGEVSGRVRTLAIGTASAQVAGEYLQRHGDSRLQIDIATPYDIAAAPGDYASSGDVLLAACLSGGHDTMEESQVSALAQLASTGAKVFPVAFVAGEGELAGYVADHDGLVVAPEQGIPEAAAKASRFVVPLLLCLMAFDGEDSKIVAHRAEVAKMMVESIIMREASVAKLVEANVSRIVFYGTGCLAGLATYAKKVAVKAFGDAYDVVAESRSDIDTDPSWEGDTALVVFVSSETEQREEDLAFIKHVKDTGKASHVVAIQQDIKPMYIGPAFSFDGFPIIGDAYIAAPFALLVRVMCRMLAQKQAPRA